MPLPVDSKLERIVNDHYLGLWRYLRFLGCDEALADDLMQDTFIAVMRGSFEYRNAAQTSSFLRTTAKRLYLNLMRDKRIGTLPLDQQLIESAAPKSQQEVELADSVWGVLSDDQGDVRIDALQACLKQLEERAHLALGLRYRDQLRGDELAQRLGVSESAAKMILYRSREQLRVCIQRRLEQ